MALSNQSPFSFIDNTINLLLVDDDPHTLELLKEIFSLIPLYSIYSADSSVSALAFLRSGKRFHVCILDLGLADIENDDFYILKQYANHCSILILTGSTSPLKGATSVLLGAKAVFEKGVCFDSRSFLETVNYYALINIVNHRYKESSGDTLNLATKVLIEKKPQSVTEWAELMRITDRQLRNLWHVSAGFSAKHILFLFILLSKAFSYYMFTYYGSGDNYTILPDHAEIKKLQSYFDTHKEIISFILD